MPVLREYEAAAWVSPGKILPEPDAAYRGGGPRRRNGQGQMNDPAGPGSVDGLRGFVQCTIFLISRGCEAAATEVGGLTRAGMATTTEAATAMLGAKTLAEAIEINAGYARRGFDAMLGGAAKLSEIGVKAATDASRPILDRIGESWKGLGGR